MRKDNICDLLLLFEGAVSPSEMLSAKLMGQISAVITAERIKRKLSQEEFAELIGTKQSQISQWESGSYNFTINKIAEIAAALELNPEFRFTDTVTSSAAAVK